MCRKPEPGMPKQLRYKAKSTARSAKQCRSNPVSSRSLPETGIFQISAGDYRAISSWKEPKVVSGDRPPICKSPPLAGISEVTEGKVSRRRTGWLTWEDSSFHITIPRNTFEMSAEFLLFGPKCDLDTFTAASCK